MSSCKGRENIQKIGMGQTVQENIKFSSVTLNEPGHESHRKDTEISRFDKAGNKKTDIIQIGSK